MCCSETHNSSAVALSATIFIAEIEQKQSIFCLKSKGAFTPDANEAIRANDLHVKSMQRRDRQSCGAIRANEAARMAQIA